MSRFDTWFDDVARPALQEHLGEPVTHRPLGRSIDDAEITAVFQETEPRLDASTGKAIARTATLYVASDVALDTRDRFQVNEEWWEAERLQAAVGGLATVFLIRVEKEQTFRGPRR